MRKTNLRLSAAHRQCAPWTFAWKTESAVSAHSAANDWSRTRTCLPVQTFPIRQNEKTAARSRHSVERILTAAVEERERERERERRQNSQLTHCMVNEIEFRQGEAIHVQNCSWKPFAYKYCNRRNFCTQLNVLKHWQTFVRCSSLYNEKDVKYKMHTCQFFGSWKYKKTHTSVLAY